MPFAFVLVWFIVVKDILHKLCSFSIIYILIHTLFKLRVGHKGRAGQLQWSVALIRVIKAET